MDLEERFRYIMKLNNLTASAFADEVGVQRSSISHILSGRNKPSLEFIQKVLKRFPKVDAAWLISGSTTVGDEKLIPAAIETESRAPKDSSQEIQREVLSDSPSASYDKSTTKGIKRILVFYNDQSFEEFTPRN